MKISELQELLARELERNGDIETTMIGTLCPIGYSMGDSDIIKDVFESTIEGAMIKDDGDLGKRLHIYWQC